MHGASLTSARTEVVLDQIARIPTTGTIPAKCRFIVWMRLIIADFHSDYSQLTASR